MKGIFYKILKQDDWELLREMRIRATTIHPDLFYDTSATARERVNSFWKDLLAQDGNRFWVFFDEDKPIGVTGIYISNSDPTGSTAEIGCSFLEKDYRRKGIVDDFYKVRLEYAKNSGRFKKIVADHRDGNEPSRKNILKHGFVFIEKVDVDWPDGSRGPECRYVLYL